VTAAVSDLNVFCSRVGAQPAKAVSPETLFRGQTPDDLIGPSISQFLWLEIPYGIKEIDQRYVFPKRGQQF
jgi:hypothetical protein